MECSMEIKLTVACQCHSLTWFIECFSRTFKRMVPEITRGGLTPYEAVRT